MQGGPAQTHQADEHDIRQQQSRARNLSIQAHLPALEPVCMTAALHLPVQVYLLKCSAGGHIESACGPALGQLQPSCTGCLVAYHLRDSDMLLKVSVSASLNQSVPYRLLLGCAGTMVAMSTLTSVSCCVSSGRWTCLAWTQQSGASTCRRCQAHQQTLQCTQVRGRGGGGARERGALVGPGSGQQQLSRQSAYSWTRICGGCAGCLIGLRLSSDVDDPTNTLYPGLKVLSWSCWLCAAAVCCVRSPAAAS